MARSLEWSRNDFMQDLPLKCSRPETLLFGIYSRSIVDNSQQRESLGPHRAGDPDFDCLDPSGTAEN